MINPEKRRLGRKDDYEDEANPLDGVANLLDIMLVFACALMVALILYWNINLDNIVNILDREQLVEITDPEMMDQVTSIAASEFDGIGTAVRDPETGMLLIVDDENIAPTE